MQRKNHLQLLWVLTKTDFKLRYHGSVLGYLWSLLKPLLIFAVLYVVFSVLMNWDVPHYEVSLLLGIIIWNFFSEGTMAGLHSLINKAELIKKIYFPRSLIVISSTLSAFLTLLLNMLVFFVFYFFNGLSFHWLMMLMPVYLILIYIFVLGLSLLLSVLQVKYRDMVQIWEVLLNAGFFITPIIYPLALVPEEYWFYLFLNPMTGIIQYSRILMIDSDLPSMIGTLYVFGVVGVITIIGFLIFRSNSLKIAEDI